MFSFKRGSCIFAAALSACSAKSADKPDPGPALGQVLNDSEVAKWDIDIAADGRGLPSGGGSVVMGQKVYETRCASCHGENGENGAADPLVGGKGSLTGQKPLRTIGSYWPHAPTIFDYVRRAMPYGAPLSLTNEETYAVTAYLLYINRIVGNDFYADAKSLPAVAMPNRNGFLPQQEIPR